MICQDTRAVYLGQLIYTMKLQVEITGYIQPANMCRTYYTLSPLNLGYLFLIDVGLFNA